MKQAFKTLATGSETGLREANKQMNPKQQLQLPTVYMRVSPL